MKEFKPKPDNNGDNFGLHMVNAFDVSDENISNRKVCIVDSGYDQGNPNLPNEHEEGWSPWGDASPWYKDGTGHGTHVAGIIVATNSNKSGMQGVIRNGELPLFISKIQQGPKIKRTSFVCSALNKCLEVGANIINMSFYVNQNDCLKAALDRASRENVLLIAAAGNLGTTEQGTRYSYPASYDNVVSVAAVNALKKHAPFSQRNDQVNIAAPGVNIQSTCISSKCRESGAYVRNSGTSMAVPFVSGVAALVWSHCPDTCTAATIKDILLNSAIVPAEEDSIFDTNGIVNPLWKKFQIGRGIVNAKAAFDYALERGLIQKGSSLQPSGEPSTSSHQTFVPTISPSSEPSHYPSKEPTNIPTSLPSAGPSQKPSEVPTDIPTVSSSTEPSQNISEAPTYIPTSSHSIEPFQGPSEAPIGISTSLPSTEPSRQLSDAPIDISTSLPSTEPSRYPTFSPTKSPVSEPTAPPSFEPSLLPSFEPIDKASTSPSSDPSVKPIVTKSIIPSSASSQPSGHPSKTPSKPSSVFSSSLPSNELSISSPPSTNLSESSRPTIFTADIDFCKYKHENTIARKRLLEIVNYKENHKDQLILKSLTDNQKGQALKRSSQNKSKTRGNSGKSSDTINTKSGQKVVNKTKHGGNLSEPLKETEKMSKKNKTSAGPTTDSRKEGKKKKVLKRLPKTKIVKKKKTKTKNPPPSKTVTILAQSFLEFSTGGICECSSNILFAINWVLTEIYKDVVDGIDVIPDITTCSTNDLAILDDLGTTTSQENTQCGIGIVVAVSQTCNDDCIIFNASSGSSRSLGILLSNDDTSILANAVLSQIVDAIACETGASKESLSVTGFVALEQPSATPSSIPTQTPSESTAPSVTLSPSSEASSKPTSEPSSQPSSDPSAMPSQSPSVFPSQSPSSDPSLLPTSRPSDQPSSLPSADPSAKPSIEPSLDPSKNPTSRPSDQPSRLPTENPSAEPSIEPSTDPSSTPSSMPSTNPTLAPSSTPTNWPSSIPSLSPTFEPSLMPSTDPSTGPSYEPSIMPSMKPTLSPSSEPSMNPSEECFDSPRDWYDREGSRFNCAWYGANNSRCVSYGDKDEYRNDGKTANEVCCVCGGGIRGKTTPPSSSLSPSHSAVPTISSNPSSLAKGQSSHPTISTVPSTSVIPTSSMSPSIEPLQYKDCIDSPSEWHDSDGKEFNCEWYATKDNPSDDHRCDQYGDLNPNFDKTATEACCACGGGISGPSSIPSSSLFPSISAGPSVSSEPSNQNEYIEPSHSPAETNVPSEAACFEVPEGWHDGLGEKYNCAWYGIGGRCQNYGDSYKKFGRTAKEACCQCGGGTKIAPSAQPTQWPSISAQPSSTPSSNPSDRPSTSSQPSVSPRPSHEPSLSSGPSSSPSITPIECIADNDCAFKGEWQMCDTGSCVRKPSREDACQTCRDEIDLEWTSCSYYPSCPTGTEFLRYENVGCWLFTQYKVCIKYSDDYACLPCTDNPLKGTCGGFNRGNGCCENGGGCSTFGWCGWDSIFYTSIRPSNAQCEAMTQGLPTGSSPKSLSDEPALSPSDSSSSMPTDSPSTSSMPSGNPPSMPTNGPSTSLQPSVSPRPSHEPSLSSGPSSLPNITPIECIADNDCAYKGEWQMCDTGTCVRKPSKEDACNTCRDAIGTIETSCSYYPSCPDGSEFLSLETGICRYLGKQYNRCMKYSNYYACPPCPDNPLKGTCGGGNRGNGCCENGGGCSIFGWCGWDSIFYTSIRPSHAQCEAMSQG